MTMANEYAQLHMNTDLFFHDYKEYDKRKREFISKNSVSCGVFHGAGWYGWSIVFKDGTAVVFSSDIARKFSTGLYVSFNVPYYYSVKTFAQALLDKCKNL